MRINTVSHKTISRYSSVLTFSYTPSVTESDVSRSIVSAERTDVNVL